MVQEFASRNEIIPRSKWWWLGLGLLLLLAAWLYLRGYNASLPYFANNDEAHHLLAGQHEIDFGHARGVFHEAYPPGTRTLNYLFLKHIKPVEAHHGTMLPALRLITIGAWMLAIVLLALLGAMMLHPLTGLIAAAVWIVNPWAVERAHWALPDGYLTLFTLLALWLALVGYMYGRRSFSTAAVYSIMLAIVFKTQALFVAPIVLLLPLLNIWRMPAWRQDALQQTFWNLLRFAVFLFWLLLIYPTLEADKIVDFPMTYSGWTLPSLDWAWASFHNVWRFFPWTDNWLAVAVAAALLLLYRKRVHAVAFLLVTLSGLAWILGMSMFYMQSARQFFVVGAILAMLYGCGFTGLMYLLDEALTRLPPASRLFLRLQPFLPACVISIPLAVSLLPSYHESDALAHNFTLHDRRNDLAHYMDTSLEPGKYVTDSRSSNFKVFNRSWGGYDGTHDFPRAQRGANLLNSPIETWRENDAVYAIAPYPANADDPHFYFPDETVLLKSYPPNPRFRGPSMVVLRLYPMQYKIDGQLGPIRLVGYDLNASELAAGEDIVLRHYWRAESPTVSIMRVFNHLVDEHGEIVAQADYVPLWDDRRPTTTWDDPDEIMLGREFVLSLPLDLPPGAYRLISGWFDPATWQRLISPDGTDYIHIADIRVAQPDT